VSFEIESWMRSDPGARYADTVSIDAAAVSATVATSAIAGTLTSFQGLVGRWRFTYVED
jgi:homoaconitase/3-isopropylmalate dehydratase large subunit